MPNHRRKLKRPSLVNTFSIVSLDTTVKSFKEDGRSKETLLPIGTLVNVSRVLDEKYAAIRVVNQNKDYAGFDEELWKCPREVLVHVDHEVWPYLAAISSPVERVFFLKNHSDLNKLIALDVGSFIHVLENQEQLPAIVKYKGPVDKKGPGTFFGVELLDGEGENDGKLGNHEFFRCPPGTGMFVSVSKIMIPTSSSVNTKLTSSNSSSYLAHNADSPKQNGSSPTEMKYARGDGFDNAPLTVGDSVIWVSDDGHKQGVFLGYINSPNRVRSATVFFEEPVKLNNVSKGEQTLQLPAAELIKSSDFYGHTDQNHENNINKPQDLKASKSIDIVNRHVKSTNDLIVFDTPPNYSNIEDDLSPDYDEPEPDDWDGDTELEVGSLVQVELKGSPHYGVVRWIGRLSHRGSVTAGIEMEEEVEGFGDGMHNGKRYFDCNLGRSYFTSLSHCRRDSRFNNLDVPGPSSIYANTRSSDYPVVESPVIRGSVPPISREDDLGELCGKYRGIQGHHNSCYLDATLFSMFTFTSVFDSLLLRPADADDIEEYSEVQRVLREEIVNPLRANLYVTSDRVMKLRTLLDRLSNVSGLTSEEKDPEEFLTSLVAQILRAEPFLKLSSGQEAYLYQLFIEKDESITFPTVQQLFDQSFLASDIKLKQVPSCLIIQMPRFGKSYKMYPRILPSQVLDVTDVIEDSPRQCTVCGRLADYECKQCFNQCEEGLQSTSYCAKCIETAHCHEKRASHRKQRLRVPQEFYEFGNRCTIPRIYMSLFAVLCIETSHYVAFVKCGTGPEAPWCFFDSMADRKGEQDGYNIPEVVPCPYLPEWLSEQGVQTLNQIPDEKQLPELAKRLLCDAYMCIYQSTDVMMYS